MSHDPEGKMGPKMQLPDNVIVHEPKDETPMMMPPQERLRVCFSHSDGCFLCACYLARADHCRRRRSGEVAVVAVVVVVVLDELVT